MRYFDRDDKPTPGSPRDGTGLNRSGWRRSALAGPPPALGPTQRLAWAATGAILQAAADERASRLDGTWCVSENAIYESYGARLGISRQTVHRLTAGDRWPTLPELHHLAAEPPFRAPFEARQHHRQPLEASLRLASPAFSLLHTVDPMPRSTTPPDGRSGLRSIEETDVILVDVVRQAVGSQLTVPSQIIRNRVNDRLATQRVAPVTAAQVARALYRLEQRGDVRRLARGVYGSATVIEDVLGLMDSGTSR